jgi:ParB-like nuclease domain
MQMRINDRKRIPEVVDKAARRLTVTYHPVTDLKLDPNNPRIHTPRQVKQLRRSIAAFGFVTPVLVDGHGNVFAGHGRVLAAQQLGLTEVPTISVDHLNQNQIKAYQIADNRLAEHSTWNDRLLGEHFKLLAQSEIDFDIEVTGFTMGEIDMRIEGLTADPEDDDPADALPEMQTGPSVTQLGDRYLLGESVVCCGDALDETSYQHLMRGERATMAFVDAPFNVPIQGHVSGLRAIRHREFAMGCGEMNSEQFGAFLTRIFSLLARYSLDGAIHFICMDWRHIAEVLAAGAQVYSELKNLCVWVKNHTGMGAFYRSRHELIFVYKYGRAPHRNNIMLGKFGRNSHACVELSESPYSKRRRQLTIDASDRKAGADDRRRYAGLQRAPRHRVRQLSRKRHERDRRETHRPAFVRARDRPALRRHYRAALAGLYGRASPPCLERHVLQ